MKFHWKKLAALLLAAILMLSMAAMGEEIVVEDAIDAESTIAIEEDIAVDEDIAIDALEIDGDIGIEEPVIDGELDLDTFENTKPEGDLVDPSEEATPEQVLEEAGNAEAATAGQIEGNVSNVITLGIGELYKLNTGNLGTNLTYKSSKTDIATVNKAGIVKGVTKGSAMITVMSGTVKKASYIVKVVAAPVKVLLPVKSITLGVGESRTIEPKIVSTTHTHFTWKSSNTAIATVNRDGKITGKKAGTTTVTVTTHNDKTASLSVTVKPAPSKVTLNKTSVTLHPGNKLQLKATVPTGSVSGTLTWRTSSSAIASVSDKGIVTAQSEGVAVISVTTYNGKKATCRIKIEKIPALSANPASLNVKAGNSREVTITYRNDNTISWKTSDANIATCRWIDGWDGDKCKLAITGMKSGTATITVYDDTTQESVKIKVTVYGKVEKITELSKLMFKSIPEANAVLDLQLSHYQDNMYTCTYFTVLVDDSGIIQTVAFFNDYGAYTLLGQWPGRSLSNAVSSIFDLGFSLASDADQVGTFTHPDLPGFRLLLKYAVISIPSPS